MEEAHIPPSPFGASTTEIATILDSHISTPSYAKTASIIRLCVEQYLSPRRCAIPLLSSTDVAGQGSDSFRAVQNLHLRLPHSPLPPVRYYAAYYTPAYAMITSNTCLSAALGSHFSTIATATSPDHTVVLMRVNGMTVLGPTIQDCVLRVIYTQTNAAIQTTTLLTQAAWRAESAQVGQEAIEGINYLSEEEVEAAMEMTKWSAMRPWTLWLREVEAAGMHVNRC
jgi:hypothetical protein